MLIPKKVKHRKWHKGRIGGQASSKTNLDFGSHGLKSLEGAWISSRQIEAARRAMTRFVQKGGKIWIRIFPDKPVTNHGSEVRMGGGKGSVDHYVAVVKPGTIMFEIDGVEKSVAKEAMRLASHKLSVNTRFISKD
ncbi:MAG: 50S ribosomal protein L16 [Patescibacteria group bacterium]|jgi:large subunit ribosomal protein L16